MKFKTMFLVVNNIEALNRDVQALLDEMAGKGYVLLTLSTHALSNGLTTAHYALLVFKTFN